MKDFLKPAPQEQIVGYSVSELKSIFVKALNNATHEIPSFPTATSLASVGISAYYSMFVIDKADVDAFQKIIDERFSAINEKIFNELVATRYQAKPKDEALIASISYKEFNVTTIRLITNSIEFLSLVQKQKLAVPPPWIAFEGYQPSWWGGDMQGAQGYYNDNYFFSFFVNLTSAERSDYYARYSASDEWIRSLELMLEV